MTVLSIFTSSKRCFRNIELCIWHVISSMKIMMLSIRFCIVFVWVKYNILKVYLAWVLLNLLKITQKMGILLKQTSYNIEISKTCASREFYSLKQIIWKNEEIFHGKWLKRIMISHETHSNLKHVHIIKRKGRFALNEFRWVQQMFSID